MMKLGPFPEAEGYEEAAALDTADSLSVYREQFVILISYILTAIL